MGKNTSRSKGNNSSNYNRLYKKKSREQQTPSIDETTKTKDISQQNEMEERHPSPLEQSNEEKKDIVAIAPVDEQDVGVESATGKEHPKEEKKNSSSLGSWGNIVSGAKKLFSGDTPKTDKHDDSASPCDMKALTEKEDTAGNVPVALEENHVVMEQEKGYSEKSSFDVQKLPDGMQEAFTKLDALSDQINHLQTRFDSKLSGELSELQRKTSGIHETLIKRPQKQDMMNWFEQAERHIKEEQSSSMRILKNAIDNNKLVIDGIRKAVSDEAGQPVSKAVRSLLKANQNSQEELSGRFDAVDGKLKDIAAGTEIMQSLPSKLDAIGKVLEDKGIRLKQELPSANHEEETLVALAECGEKIQQQLLLAARWYARKLPELNAHAEEIKRMQQVNEQNVEKAHKEGMAEGRKAVIKELLSKYDDIDKLMKAEPEGAEGRLKILAAFLKNEGVEPIYAVGEQMEITADEIMNYEHNIENLKPGKIVIASPGYSFDSQTIMKASYKVMEKTAGLMETSKPEGGVTEDLPKEETTTEKIVSAHTELPTETADLPQTEKTIAADDKSAGTAEQPKGTATPKDETIGER